MSCLNDIEDDFSYPNTTIYEGYMVGKVTHAFRSKTGDFIRGEERSEEWISNYFRKLKDGKLYPGVLKEYDPRRFSSIAIIIGEFLKKKTDIKDNIYTCKKKYLC